MSDFRGDEGSEMTPKNGHQPVWWFAFNKIACCAGTKVFEEALIKCSQIFGLAQKILTGIKHFGTCKCDARIWGLNIFENVAKLVFLYTKKMASFKSLESSLGYFSIFSQWFYFLFFKWSTTFKFLQL